jgi:hypothetical protein
MEGVASWFYRIVHDAFLEHLIERVQKLKEANRQLEYQGV